MSADLQLRALVVDWGGVLTSNLDGSLAAWAAAEGIDWIGFEQLMRDWLGEGIDAELRRHPVHALERGEIEVPDFENQLAARLNTRGGAAVNAEGLIHRMFSWLEHEPDMAGLVRRAKEAGIRTGLLSNSWGNTYPRHGWDEMFDAIVISGEVGMRKPEPEIYRHALDLLGVAADEAVFVDDLLPNVRAAAAIGMVGVHHTSYGETLAELEVLFGLPLRS